MNLEDFVVPRVKVEEDQEHNYCKFIIEPLERGYGITIGNSLRRVLLASLYGASITSVKFDGIYHEFSAIPGVVEDMSEVILNLKGVRIKPFQRKGKKVIYEGEGPKEVLAQDLIQDNELQVLNPSHHIMTLQMGAKVQMELDVDIGRGYVLAEENKKPDSPIGTIAIDSIFSPVCKANLTVEDARVGHITDYDRLILEIWTDGSITPEEALASAADILIQHFSIFTTKKHSALLFSSLKDNQQVEEIKKTLSRSVQELDLTVRSFNCLKAANIKTIGNLVSKTESEMLKNRNFGKKSLEEIKGVLSSMGLSFGLNVKEYLSPEEEETPAEE